MPNRATRHPAPQTRTTPMPERRKRPFGTHGKVHQITPHAAGWRHVGFDLWRLRAGDRVGEPTGPDEVIPVRVEGKASLTGAGQAWGEVGARMDVFEKTPPHCLDLYHTQIGEGDLVRRCETCLPRIGEVQVADNPRRCEADTGEITDKGVARALVGMGYRGPVGMEAFAKGDSDAAVDAFLDAFTL